MSLDGLDPHEPEGEPGDMPGTSLRPQRTVSNKSAQLKTPMQLFLEDIDEFPLLTESLEKKFADLKDEAGRFFQQQAGILELAVLESLAAGHAGRQETVEVLNKIKSMILRREAAMADGRRTSADAAFRRMVRASRRKVTFAPTLLEADAVTDEIFTSNLFAVMQKHVGLCQRIVTSGIEEVAALASITRESFALLRGAMPAGHPALLAMAERDAAFKEKITADEECRSYLAPLLQRRALANIGVTTPQDVLMRANLRLVVKIARGYLGKRLELPDLVEEGNMGLYRAIERFKTSKNVRFCNYASYWIKQQIQRALANQSRAVRLPAYAIMLVSKWRRTGRRLHDRLGHEPSEEEIQAELKLPANNLRIVKSALQIAGAQFLSEGDPVEAVETSADGVIEQHYSSASDRMAQDDESDLVSALLDKLDPIAAQVIRLRFPQDRSEPKTLREIGQTLGGLSRERVRQIERAVLLALRNAASDEPEEEEAEADATPIFTGRPGRPHKSPVRALGTLEAEALPDFGAGARASGGHVNGRFSGNGPLPGEADARSGQEDTTARHLTEEGDGVPSPSFTLPPMPRRSSDAWSERQNLSSEEKSVARQNVQVLINRHKLSEVIRRMREKGHNDGAARQAISRAANGSGISPKYVSCLEDIFGVNVVSAGGTEQSEPMEEGERKEPAPELPRRCEQEPTATQREVEVLAQEVQLTETYRRKLAEALRVSLVRNADGKVVFRIAQTDVEPV